MTTIGNDKATWTKAAYEQAKRRKSLTASAERVQVLQLARLLHAAALVSQVWPDHCVHGRCQVPPPTVRLAARPAPVGVGRPSPAPVKVEPMLPPRVLRPRPSRT